MAHKKKQRIKARRRAQRQQAQCRKPIWLDEAAQLRPENWPSLAQRLTLRTGSRCVHLSGPIYELPTASLQSLLLHAIAQGWTVEQLLDGDDVYPGGLRALFPGLQPVVTAEVA